MSPQVASSLDDEQLLTPSLPPGSTLFNVLDHLRSYRSTYPSVKVAWDEVVSPFPSPQQQQLTSAPQAPSSSPILLSLASPPLSLLFDPPTQRLLRIELNADKAGEWVSYRGKSLRESEGEDVVRTVRRVMGPTYGASGVQLGVGEEEMLSYPGVAFGVVLGSEGESLLGDWSWRGRELSVWLQESDWRGLW